MSFPTTQAQFIVEKALETPEGPIVDEIYAQLIKQLISNPSRFEWS